MTPNEELALFAQELAMRCVSELQEIYVKNPEAPTPEESEAVINGVTYVCATLEGYLIACLPDARRFNVRAALDTMAHVFAKAIKPGQLLTPPSV